MGKRNKIMLLLLTTMLVFSFMLTGCNSETDVKQAGTEAQNTDPKTAAENTGDKGKIKIIVAAANMSDPFYSWLCNSTTKAFDKDYPDVEYKVVDLKGDSTNVPNVIEQASLEGYSGLILDKVSHAQNTDQLLQDAKKAGVNTVLSNNSDIKDGVSSSSGASNYILGHTVGLKAAELLPQGAKVCAILSTPGDAGSEDRWKGYQDALKEKGRNDLNILAIKNNDGWAKEKAMAIMEDWLQVYPQIDGILAMNDGMALGCIEAAKAAGRDLAKMQFYGIDGLGDSCLSIKADEMTASVLQDADDMGSNAVRIVVGMIKGEITSPEGYLIKPITITKDNVDEVIAIHKANGALK